MTRHTLVLEFETTADIPDLIDIVQQRVYLLDGVKKGDMRCTTLENYLWDLSRRADVQELPVLMKWPECEPIFKHTSQFKG